MRSFFEKTVLATLAIPGTQKRKMGYTQLRYCFRCKRSTKVQRLPAGVAVKLGYSVENKYPWVCSDHLQMIRMELNKNDDTSMVTTNPQILF